MRTAAPIETWNIPAELKALRQWLVWRGEWTTRKDGSKKLDKLPFQTNGNPASTTDPATWTDFDSAVAYAEEYGLTGTKGGIGFVLREDQGYVFVDLDHCIVDGECLPEADAIIKRLGGYAELSVSGTGWHVVLKGKKPSERCQRAWQWNGSHAGQIEVYEKHRFLTFTGSVHEHSQDPIPDRQEAFAAWYQEVFPESKNGVHIAASAQGRARDDDEVLGLLRRYNANKFEALWRGDTAAYQGDESRATAALLCLIAFYTRDTAQIDRLFRQSGLMRPKWDDKRNSSTWGAEEITKALDTVTETYSGGACSGGVSGPYGLSAEIKSARVTPKKITAMVTITIDGEPAIWSISSAPSSIDDAAREILGRLPEEGNIFAVKKFLRSILDAARASKEKPAGARSMLEIVRQEGEWFRFAFRDDKGRLWSERLRAFLWHRLFLESLVTPELIERLGQARDAPDDLARIGHRAERLGKQVWAEIVRITPEEADAADLGQDSKAASEFLEAIHAVWTTSKTMETNRDGTHRTASTLVAAGAHKAGLFTDGKWHQVHPPLAAWARLEGKTLELAMRHELFRQVGINPPARVRDFETFRRLATRYGACDRTSKVGKQAGMGVVLPARITEELLASFGEAE